MKVDLISFGRYNQRGFNFCNLISFGRYNQSGFNFYLKSVLCFTFAKDRSQAGITKKQVFSKQLSNSQILKLSNSQNNSTHKLQVVILREFCQIRYFCPWSIKLSMSHADIPKNKHYFTHEVQVVLLRGCCLMLYFFPWPIKLCTWIEVLNLSLDCERRSTDW